MSANFNVAGIARALGRETRVSRDEYRCACPVHGGRSLVIKNGHTRLIWHCFGGCSGAAVGNALRGRGLLPRRSRR